MTADELDVAGGQASYLRGGGAGSNRPQMVRVFVASCAVALAALVVVLFVQARADNARADRLHDHGVPVVATVTGCIGVLSGTGVTEAFFQCRAAFSIGGAHHTEIIRGSTVDRPTGSTVQAVVDPRDPSSLSTAAAAAGRAHASSYIAAAISLGVLVAYVGVVLAWLRRRQN